ncbi:flagellin [Pseudooceanicola sp. C21-150M6]|uniref:flagellin n=1 Tax=Pseudooceanicola sp. C21-150M6 TaxID=3434355 RepID=UPI003D7F7D53
MSLTSIGDLAQSYLLRRHNTDLKSQLTTLAEELASGRAADTGKHLSGSYSYLADVERKLSLLDGYTSTSNEARILSSSMQDTLEGFQNVALELGNSLLSSSQAKMANVTVSASRRAAEDFASLISKINVSVGGRHIFSGIQTDAPALAEPDVILDALKSEIASETTLDGISTKLNDWFAVSGAYDTIAYQGDATPLANISLREGEDVSLTIKGDDPAIRDVLKYVAMGALASDPDLGFATDLQNELIEFAGKNLSFQHDGVTQIRAELGYDQEKIDESSTRLSAERTALELAKSELLSVDPFETVSRLEAVQTQLESLYGVTARLSRLSLSNYLT